MKTSSMLPWPTSPEGSPTSLGRRRFSSGAFPGAHSERRVGEVDMPILTTDHAWLRQMNAVLLYPEFGVAMIRTLTTSWWPSRNSATTPQYPPPNPHPPPHPHPPVICPRIRDKWRNGSGIPQDLVTSSDLFPLSYSNCAFWIHVSTTSRSTANGSAPEPRIVSWKSRMSNLSPMASSARARSASISIRPVI